MRKSGIIRKQGAVLTVVCGARVSHAGLRGGHPWVCLAISFYVIYYYRLDLEKNQGFLANAGGEISACFLFNVYFFICPSFM